METTGSLRNKHFDSTIIWDISNFSSKCSKVGESIESPFFSAGGTNEIKWHISLYPFGETKKYESFLSLFLIATFRGDVTECNISIKFYLYNNEVNAKNCTTTTYDKNNNGWGFPMFLERNGDNLKNHLSLSSNDTLSIACCITIPSNVDTLSPSVQLIKDLKTSFLSESLSDITIEVDNEELKAHKIILSARSKVFSAMFKHNTIESNENKIKITDISYDVMKEVLRFIYCGEVENLDTLKEDLLAAADKYDLPSLKRVCEQVLLNNINVVNVCEILRISDLHQCHKLKDAAIKFIIKNMKEIVDSKEIDKIKDPKLLTDIIYKISQKTILNC